MDYRYTASVRTDDALRRSFNELTRRTFGFDFVNWYEAGHWGNCTSPMCCWTGTGWSPMSPSTG